MLRSAVFYYASCGAPNSAVTAFALHTVAEHFHLSLTLNVTLLENQLLSNL